MSLWKIVLKRNHLEQPSFLRPRKTHIFTFWTRLHQLSKSFSSLQKNPLGGSKKKTHLSTVQGHQDRTLVLQNGAIGPELQCGLWTILLACYFPTIRIKMAWAYLSPRHCLTWTHAIVHSLSPTPSLPFPCPVSFSVSPPFSLVCPFPCPFPPCFSSLIPWDIVTWWLISKAWG